MGRHYYVGTNDGRWYHFETIEEVIDFFMVFIGRRTGPVRLKMEWR